MSKGFPIVISLIALIISAGTFVFNNALKVDSLKYVLSGQAGGYVEDGEVRLRSDYKISFINMGTRPIAITRMTFGLLQDAEAKFDNNYDACNKSHGYFSFKIDVPPFVVQKGEISIKELSSISKDPEITRSYKWNVEKLVGDRDNLLFRTCLLLFTVTPGSLTTARMFPLSQQRLGIDGSSKAPSDPFIADNFSKPTTVLDEWSIKLW